MQRTDAKDARRVVILATGGTIAGRATDPAGSAYRAGAVEIDELLDGASRDGVAGAAPFGIETETVARIDSKDMDFATWQRLARQTAHHLRRDEVAGVVVTHGTDTVEETAYFLHRVLAPAKPVVLTAAMRPADALSPDGPAHLRDAIHLAGGGVARGVCFLFGGAVWHPAELRKVHTVSPQPFAGGDGGPIARFDQGVWRLFRPWANGTALGLARIAAAPEHWPQVEIVLNHAGADGRLLDAAVADGARGIVVAGTGHGTLSERLQAAVDRARVRGVEVRRASRCAFGPVLPSIGEPPVEAAGELSAVQARVDLLLDLLGRAESSESL